jgi:hypothetical protein
MASAPINPVEALAELAQQVRVSTIKLLQVPEESWLTWTPRGTSNHILWHAGHAVWLQDALTIRPLTGRSELQSGWAENFGQQSRPTRDAVWPPDSEVHDHLERQLERILNLLAENGQTIISRAASIPRGGGWPLLAGMVHGWHDEARHQGEMYLLYKLQLSK